MLLEILSAFIKGQLQPGQFFLDSKGTKFEVIPDNKLRIIIGDYEMEFTLSVSNPVLLLFPAHA